MKIKIFGLKLYAILALVLAVVVISSSIAGAVGVVGTTSKATVSGSGSISGSSDIGSVSGSSSSSPGSETPSGGEGNIPDGNVGTLDTPINNPPDGYIYSITPNPSVHGQQVTLVGYGEDPDAGDEITYYWDFTNDGSYDFVGYDDNGDGYSNAYYSYTVPSNYNTYVYTIRLKLKDTQGGEYYPPTQTITANAYPVANIDAPDYADVNVEVTFDGSGSYDPNGNIVSWHWNFGDGYTGNGEIVTHSYSSGGTKTVTLTVTDNLGGTGQAQVTINIREIIFDIYPEDLTQYVGEYLSFGCTVLGCMPNQYMWNFGDNSQEEGQCVIHKYSGIGTYEVILTITVEGQTPFNDNVLVNIISGNASPNNDPMSEPYSNPTTVEPNENVYFIGEDSTDSDGTIVGYKWFFGDATSLDGMNVQHSYTAPDGYNAFLRVIDDLGAVNVHYTDVVVENSAGDPMNSGYSGSSSGSSQSSSSGSSTYNTNGQSSSGSNIYLLFNQFYSIFNNNIIQFLTELRFARSGIESLGTDVNIIMNECTWEYNDNGNVYFYGSVERVNYIGDFEVGFDSTIFDGVYYVGEEDSDFCIIVDSEKFPDHYDTVTITADPNNLIEESDDTDNSCILDITIPQGKPSGIPSGINPAFSTSSGSSSSSSGSYSSSSSSGSSGSYSASGSSSSGYSYDSYATQATQYGNYGL